MFKNSTQKVANAVILFFFLFLLCLVPYLAFGFPAGRLLALFKWKYIWTNALVYAVDYFTPVTASAVMVTYSLLLTRKDSRLRAAALPFHRLVSAHLLLFLILAAAYTVLLISLYPQAQESLERMEEASSQAKLFLARAEKEHRARNYSAALSDYNLYLAIDPRNQEVLLLREKAQSQVAEERAQATPSRESGLQPGEGRVEGKKAPPAEDANALIEKAREYLAREDFFSAHYYATQAGRLDPSRGEPKRIAAQAWEKIGSLQETLADQEAKRLFQRKREGYTAFLNGDFIKAYYLFQELKAGYPADADIATYAARSREKIEEQSFFIEDVEGSASLPGPSRLLFVNDSGSGAREIVYLGKMVGTDEGVFFYNIEALRFQLTGGLIAHYRAPYGKLIGDSIHMVGISRNGPQRETRPVLLAGSPGGGADPLLRLTPTLEELKALRVGGPRADSLDLGLLLKMRGRMGAYGLIPQAVELEIIMRMAKLFSFLVLCFFSVSLGWSFRSRYPGRPPLPAFLLVPFVPIAMSFLAFLYQEAQRVLLGFILFKLGFAAGLAGLLLLQGLLLFLSLILLAGQKTD